VHSVVASVKTAESALEMQEVPEKCGVTKKLSEREQEQEQGHIRRITDKNRESARNARSHIIARRANGLSRLLPRREHEPVEFKLLKSNDVVLSSDDHKGRGQAPSPRQ
jgi:hypothetical protein